MQTMQLFDQPEKLLCLAWYLAWTSLLLWLVLTTEIVDKCPERYSMANDHRCPASCFNHAGYLPDNNRDVNINVTMIYNMKGQEPEWTNPKSSAGNCMNCAKMQ